MSRLWIPISYVNKFRCFLSSCFNALNQIVCLCLSLTYTNYCIMIERAAPFFVCASSIPFETHISSFHFRCHNEAFFSLLLDTLFPLKYIWIKMYKFGEWYVVTSYHCRSYCFFLFQHDAWWYEKISIYKMFLYIQINNTHHHIIIDIMLNSCLGRYLHLLSNKMSSVVAQCV